MVVMMGEPTMPYAPYGNQQRPKRAASGIHQLELASKQASNPSKQSRTSKTSNKAEKPTLKAVMQISFLAMTLGLAGATLAAASPSAEAKGG